MSETREVYDAVMQPGAELDALVARVMGLDYVDLWECRFSGDGRAALEAWAWLEENHPWQPRGVALQRSRGKPAVYLTHYDDITLTTGETYAHAIALAVVEAGKALGVIDAPPET